MIKSIHWTYCLHFFNCILCVVIGWCCNSWASPVTPLGFPLTVISDRWCWMWVGRYDPEAQTFLSWTQTLWASLLDFVSPQVFSFRFTQRLNMFCFELTSHCSGSIPFFSLRHGFHLNSYDASVDTSASNSSAGLYTNTQCVCLYLMRVLIYIAILFSFFIWE